MKLGTTSVNPGKVLADLKKIWFFGHPARRDWRERARSDPEEVTDAPADPSPRRDPILITTLGPLVRSCARSLATNVLQQAEVPAETIVSEGPPPLQAAPLRLVLDGRVTIGTPPAPSRCLRATPALPGGPACDPPQPRRDGAQYWVNPRHSNVPFPRPDAWRASGFPHAINAVRSG